MIVQCLRVTPVTLDTIIVLAYLLMCSECPLLVVTGPTSLVKSSSSLSNKRLSDNTTDHGSPARLSDVMEHLASPTTHDDDHTAISGALSDGELDLCAATNHRIVRSGRFTVHGSKV